MQKDGELVWDQTTIDKLWVTTQREAMIEAGPPLAANAVRRKFASQEGDRTALNIDSGERQVAYDR